MLLARLLAFLGLLLLAPVAHAAPGDAATGPGLISADALIEAPPRLAPDAQDADGAERLPRRPQAICGPDTRISPATPPPPVPATRRFTAQPRAPPFAKA